MIKFLLGLLALIACNSSEFGGSGRKNPPPKVANPPISPPEKAPPPVSVKEPVAAEAPAEEVPDIPPEVPVPPPPGPKIKKIVMAVNRGKTQPLDIVWVNDNSGSMSNEINQVRVNFDRFTSELIKMVDIKLILISRAGFDGTGMSLAPSLLAMGHYQLPIDVDSSNGLAIALDGLCPANGSICSPQLGQRIRGQVAAALRPGAKLVFVFVTDDDAGFINDASFLSHLYSLGRSAIVNGIVGLQSAQGCDIASKGNSYISLASRTKGQIFDICSPDWSSHFRELLKKMYEASQPSYNLPVGTKPQQVKEVKLDGRVLTSQQYKIQGLSLVLAEGIINAQSKTIEVSIEK